MRHCSRQAREILYGTYLGGSATEGVRAIAVDSAGIIYLTGDTGSTDFPTSQDALQPANAGGNRDAFVTYLDPATGVLLYSSYLGGAGEDVGTGIAAVSGAVLLTGYTASTDFPTASALIGSNAGKQDGFVAVLASDATGAATIG